MSPKLEEGDFLYQSDQELFLVVIDEIDDEYIFAAHGWRTIDKSRVKEYIEDDRSKVHEQEKLEKLVDEKGDDQTEAQFNKLKQLFAVYENADIPRGGPQNSFQLEDK
jgi:hypothetical protein